VSNEQISRPADLAERHLRRSGGSAIRSLLARMVGEGAIRRTTHGRYELVKR
jgi:hypothetical protein